jgi:hypothetical protein
MRDALDTYKEMQKYKCTSGQFDALIKQHQEYRNHLQDILREKHADLGHRVWIHDADGNEKWVYESQLEIYTNMGWTVGVLHNTANDYIWITDGKEDKRVKEEEISEYLSNGWSKGRCESSTTKGYTLIHKDDQMKSVRPNDLDFYLSSGWELGEIPGRHFSGFCILTNLETGKVEHIAQEKREELLASGKYIEKNAITGRMHISKDGKSKMINADELEGYLREGWAKGRVKSYTANKMWICNDNTSENLRVEESDLQKYFDLGWRKGRIFKKKS